MDRKEFLSQVGMGAAMMLGMSCLAGCSKSSDGSSAVPKAPTGVDFTLDLTSATNASLASLGGYIYSGGIIVARTLAGDYVAVSQACTHEGVTVQYDKAGKQFWCPSHGARFTETGSVVSGPTSVALKQYTTVLTGNSLRVTG